MLTNEIKQSDSCQMFIKYSIGAIPSKNSRGKDSHRKNTTDTPKETVKVSKESDLGPPNRPTEGRRPRGVIIQDTPKQEALDTMQAIKNNRKTSRRHPTNGGSSKGTGSIPGVPDESTVIFSTSHEGTGVKPWVPDEGKGTSAADISLSDEENAEYRACNDEYVHEDEEIKDAKDVDTGKDDAKVTDVNIADDEKTEEVKKDDVQAGKEVSHTDQAKDTRAQLPPTNFSLSVSFSFGNKFLNLSSDRSQIVSINPYYTCFSDSCYNISSTPSCYLYHITCATNNNIIPIPPISTEALTFITVVVESPSIITAALTVVQLRVTELEKDVSKLKQVDHSAEVLAFIKSQVPSVMNKYIGTSMGDALQKVLQKHTADLIKQHSVKKSDLFQTMNETKSFNKHPTNQALYHALMEVLIVDEESMDKGVADSLKQHKRQHEDDDDDDPSTRPNQGKQNKRRRNKESKTSKKPSTTKETSRDVVYDDDQAQEASKPKNDKTPKHDWLKHLERPPTPYPKWNIVQVILSVVSVKVKKLHGYGHLEEIVVRRADRQLYKFKEGNFVDLHLNNIEDMLLLAVQRKLFQLDGSVIVDFVVALRMFTRSLVIKRRAEDLQLGVESYQKKLNLTNP
uniref:Uncharacterized protein n=1 Tax=Tanacetum cinerariifolium TaxID=118510 RepID=A0A699H2U1_TANCI|nr:hypothetical protein [Tanacetum cinerariifolium]